MYLCVYGVVVVKDDFFVFYLVDNEQLKVMYFDVEYEDVYYCDQFVFFDGISIEDMMNFLGQLIGYRLRQFKVEKC